MTENKVQFTREDSNVLISAINLLIEKIVMHPIDQPAETGVIDDIVNRVRGVVPFVDKWYDAPIRTMDDKSRSDFENGMMIDTNNVAWQFAHAVDDLNDHTTLYKFGMALDDALHEAKQLKIYFDSSVLASNQLPL